MTPDQIISDLRLSPHPEGGWYRQTWQASTKPGDRAAGTAIYFLLKKGEVSHWHRVDAAEIWHYYSGAPLILSQSTSAKGPAHQTTLGPDLAKGQRPQHVIPAGDWQSAQTTGSYTLVGCTVSPGFQFQGFELAPPEFHID